MNHAKCSWVTINITYLLHARSVYFLQIAHIYTYKQNIHHKQIQMNQ